MLRESVARISGKVKQTIAIAKAMLVYLISLMIMACGQPSASVPASLSASAEAQKNDASDILKISDVPDGELWFKLQFVNERDGWLADNRNIWRTADGGTSWEVVYSIKRPEDLPPQIPAHRLKEYAEAFTEVEAIHFMNALQGLLRTSNGTYKTEDGGKTWTKFITPLDLPRGRMSGMMFLKDGRTGWIVGGVYRAVPRKTMLKAPNNAVSPDNKSVLYGAIFRTDDGGISWSQQLVTPEMGMLLRLHFVDTEHGWAAGDVGIFHTKDGGKQWEADNLKGDCGNRELSGEAEGYPVDIFFIDRNTGWLSYKYGSVAKSSDGGRTWCALWQPQSVLPEAPENASFRNIYFVNPSRGWGLSVDGSLHQTKDSGATWTKVDTDVRFEDIYFLDPDHGWALSKEGLFRINS